MIKAQQISRQIQSANSLFSNFEKHVIVSSIRTFCELLKSLHFSTSLILYLSSFQPQYSLLADIFSID